MNVKKTIDGIMDTLTKYGAQLSEKYGVGDVKIVFYPVSAVPGDEELIKACKSSSSYFAPIDLKLTFVTDDVENESESVIKDVSGAMYYSYEQIYELLLRCNMNTDDFFTVTKFWLRFNIGHLCAVKTRYIGRMFEASIDDYMKYNSANIRLGNRPFNERIRHFIDEFTTAPIMVDACKAADITAGEIAEAFTLYDKED